MIKLTKAEYDALPAAMKKLFKADGDDYVFNTGEEDSALKRAKEHEKQLRLDAEKELKELKEEKEKAEREQAGKKGDIDSVNASWQKKLDKAIEDKQKIIDAREASLKQLLVTNKAQELAAELSETPHLLIPFLEKRLAADFAEDGKASTRVLDKDGKLSALSLDELKTETLADKQFSTILKGSSASGGGANGGGSEGGAFNAKDYKRADGTTDWAKVNEARKTIPDIVEKVRTYNADPANAAAAAQIP